jgi:nitroreductase
MDVLEAIRTRRSINKVKPDCPPRHTIESILEAATWAPNHHRVEPWRFFVLAGEARQAFGTVMAEALADQRTITDQVARQEFVATQKEKTLRAPVIVAVVVDLPQGSKVLDMENVQAVAAAVQNLLLAAHAHGLGTIWRTGAAAYAAKVKAFFGLTAYEHVAGFIYIGYPDMPPPQASRQPLAKKTTWLGWEHTG